MKQRPRPRYRTHRPALLMFALPTLGSSVLQSANGSIDAVWSGGFWVRNALAATTNGNLIMFLLTAFCLWLRHGLDHPDRRSIGRSDLAGAKEVVGTAIGSFVPLALLIAAGGWFLAPQLLALLGTRRKSPCWRRIFCA